MLYIPPNQSKSKQFLGKLPVVSRYGVEIDQYEIATATQRYIQRLGLNIVLERYWLNKPKTCVWGVYDISTDDTDCQLDIGIPSYYSLAYVCDTVGQKSFQVIAGARLIGLDHGILSGFTVKRKRRGDFARQSVIIDGVEGWLSVVNELEAFIHSMQNYPLSSQLADKIITDARPATSNGQGLMAWSHLEKVFNNWYHPLPEFKERTLWSLYNCFSREARALHPNAQVTLFSRLNNMIKEYTNAKIEQTG